MIASLLVFMGYEANIPRNILLVVCPINFARLRDPRLLQEAEVLNTTNL